MRIQASSVQMSAQHHLVEKHEIREQLQSWIGPPPGATPKAAAPPIPDQVSLSGGQPPPTSKEGLALDELATVDHSHPQLTILRLLLERLTGRRIINCTAANVMKAVAQPARTILAKEGGTAAQPVVANQGWGMIYNYHESVYRAEGTSFSASGTFSTDDGREVAFQIDLAMKSEYSRQTDLSLRAGAALQDPLVLNLSGAPPAIGEPSLPFDLNADGQQEKIGQFSAGNAFLVLDRNNDGTVNDGSELFGPTTGDGFRELASYDSDHNGWIDEVDPIFSQLKLWLGEDPEGRQLQDLAVQGVGAIYLGRVATPFSLGDTAGNLAGKVNETGIFAREDGTVGTIQQIDMVA